MTCHLPATMRTLELRSYDGATEALTIAERPLPQPQQNQVLIRMTAAPINPSDLMFLRGQYGVRKPLPVIPGWEGSGTVVAAGAGLWAHALRGRSVACGALTHGNGTWAEYMVTSVQQCIPLLKSVSALQGATMLVNPLTAWALVDIARRTKQRAILQTAAASALGAMIRRLAQRFGITVVNVVRRAEQVDHLHAQGATHVLNSSAPHFDQELRDHCQQWGVSLAFDAVAGEMPDRLLKAMPRGSRIIVYGALAGAASCVDPGRLIFRGQRIDGFWLVDWLARQRPLQQLRAALLVQRLLGDDLKTGVRACLPLEEAARGLELYKHDMSAGKVLLMPVLQR